MLQFAYANSLITWLYTSYLRAKRFKTVCDKTKDKPFENQYAGIVRVLVWM